jgi:hypothetical protein
MSNSLKSHTARTPRLLHISLLQIYGTLCVLGYHCHIRGVAFSGVIELFFVIAGFNMAASMERYDNVRSFVLGRVRRLLPEVGVIWYASLICFIVGCQRWENGLFLSSAPFFLQNYIESFFDTSMSINYLFLFPMWFVAALMQLQVLVFIFRRHLLFANVGVVLGVSLTLTGLAQALTAMVLGGLYRNLDYMTADLIYRLPFTHLTAMIIGIMLGLGRLKGFTSYFPAIAFLWLGAGLINMHAMNSILPLSSFGYPALMSFNYQYLWGYPLSALFMASFVARSNWFEVTLSKIKMPVGLEKWLHQLALLTYATYVFHGLTLTAGENGLRRAGWPINSFGRFVFFLLIAAVTFFLAWLFQILRRRVAVDKVRLNIIITQKMDFLFAGHRIIRDRGWLPDHRRTATVLLDPQKMGEDGRHRPKKGGNSGGDVR